MGFSLVAPHRDMASQHGKGRNIYVTLLRYSANHNTMDSWPIRAHLYFRMMSFVKIYVFQKGGV